MCVSPVVADVHRSHPTPRPTKEPFSGFHRFFHNACAPASTRGSLPCSPASIRSALSRMNESEAAPDAAPSRFQRTLIQVLVVQVVALTLLGLLQVFYTR